jgi:hypothetical protein
MQRAARWAAGLGTAALLALTAGWFARSASQHAHVGMDHAGPTPPAATPRPAAPAAIHLPPAVEPALASGPRTPLIDDVVVEKPELCAGEETLVTVRAHTPDDSDAELHYLIGSGTGRSVPVRAWVDEQGRPPEFQVTAFGRDNAAASVPVPPLRIKPCRVGTFVVLSHRSLPNRWGTFEFRARLRDGATVGGAKGAAAPAVPPAAPAASDERTAGTPVRAQRYLWTFGDGTRGETRGPVVTHSYEDRSQQALYAQFLVRVDVVTEDGRSLVARDALQLPNPAYESWTRKGIVSLVVALDPPFPVLSPAGRVEQGVRLRHYRPDPVTIESVHAVRSYASGAGQSLPVDVLSLLGTTSIPAGSGLELHVSLDPEAEPDLLLLTYYLKGKSAEGRPVIGSFSVMRPPPRPSAENSTPVTDARLLAKIRRARERLGKDVVSDEDLARLERQGELQDL